MQIEENWPMERIRPDEDDAIWDLLIALQAELDHVDTQAETLKDERFIDTATDDELRKLAAEVGVFRETGKTEERFRFRAKVAKLIQRSQSTFPEFAQLLHGIFGDDVDEVTLSTVSGEPVVQLNVPTVLMNDIPVNSTELETLLEDAISASDGITVVTDDTLILGQSGSQGLGADLS